MGVFKGNRGGKPASFKKQAGATPKQVTVDPKQPAKQQKFNLTMQSKSYSGAKPSKAETTQVDRKNFNKNQLANIKAMASMKYGQGDNPYRGNNGPAPKK